MRGGKRIGAGRKSGSKDSISRTRKSRLPKPDEKQIKKYKKVTKPLHIKINKYLSKGNRKLYKELFVKYDDPVAAARALLNDLLVRYNYGRIAEMEGADAARRLNIEKAELLKAEGKLKEAEELLKEAEKTPTVSSALTHLAAEIRQLTNLVHNMEAGSSKGKKNIFLIFNNEKLAQEAEKSLFKLPDDVIQSMNSKEGHNNDTKGNSEK